MRSRWKSLAELVRLRRARRQWMAQNPNWYREPLAMPGASQPPSPPVPASQAGTPTASPSGARPTAKFDRAAYMRDYMRDWMAKRREAQRGW